MTRPRLTIVVRRKAAGQIERASDWWNTNREGSPHALSDELARALELISRQPGIGVPAESRPLHGVRRILLPRVGYFLFYRIAPRKNEPQILAFWHARRGSHPEF